MQQQQLVDLLYRGEQIAFDAFRQQRHGLTARTQTFLLHALTDPRRQRAHLHRPDLHSHTDLLQGLMPFAVTRRRFELAADHQQHGVIGGTLSVGLQGLTAGIAGLAVGHAQFQQTTFRK